MHGQSLARSLAQMHVHAGARALGSKHARTDAWTDTRSRAARARARSTHACFAARTNFTHALMHTRTPASAPARTCACTFQPAAHASIQLAPGNDDRCERGGCRPVADRRSAWRWRRPRLQLQEHRCPRVQPPAATTCRPTRPRRRLLPSRIVVD